MNRFNTALALLALTVSANVFASDKCQAGPQDQWQSKEALEKKVLAQGIQIKRIKIDDGCYEVYGLDAKGNKVEQYFHPKTLEALK